MPEITVTHMMEECDNMVSLSGSRCEWGENASDITWRNSTAYGAEHPLLTTDELRDAARSHFREYGAWSQEEIDAAASAMKVTGLGSQWRALTIGRSLTGPYFDNE